MYTSIATWTKFLLTFHKSFEKTKIMHSFSIAHILAQHYTLLVGTQYKNKEVNDQTCFFFCLSLSLNMNTSLSFGMVNGLRFGFTTDSITENKNKRLSLQVLESIMPLLLF